MTELERNYRKAFGVLGALVLVMGLAIVGDHFQFKHQLASQREQQNKCFAQSFAKLTKTLEARGALASQEAENTKAVILGTATIKDSSDFQQLLANYKRATDRTAAERKSHPYPPFPSGKCQ